MSELRGLYNAQPGFKTTYWDRSRLHDVLNRNYHVYKKYFVPQRGKGPPPASGAPPGASALVEFEELINSPNTREVELQAFLEAHPSFLTGISGGVSEVFSSPLLVLDEERHIRPDFLLRPALGDRWSIVELKSPMAPPLTHYRGRGRPSRQLLDAAAQLRMYREYFRSRASRAEVKRSFGSDIYEPRLVMLVGRGDAKPEEFAHLRSEIPEIEIVSYEDILQFAKERLKSEGPTA